MLTIRCASCRRKLWKYRKIGPGEVLRCHKDRITRDYKVCRQKEHKLYCACGKEIAIDKGGNFKMVAKAFTYSGSKEPSAR